MTGTIHSNSERSEQFLVTECYPGDFSDLKKQNNYNSNWKKLLGFRNLQEKLENCISRLKAERMEAEVTLFEEQDETEKIREDIRRLEFQIQTLRGAQFG